MNPVLNAQTKIDDLLADQPYLADVLVRLNPKFALLKNPLARATIGKVATLGLAAEMGGMPLEELIASLAAEIQARTGGAAAPAPPLPQGERLAALKGMIRDLHAGKDPAAIQREFGSLLASAAPGELGKMEEELIREGLPVSEVQRLCDVHVGLFKGALEQAAVPADAPSGHPVHTYREENQRLQERADAFGALLQQLGTPYGEEPFRRLAPALSAAFEELALVDRHYLRKENQLFPFLEKHGVTAPPKVMWGVDDQIRAGIKEVRAALKAGRLDVLREKAPAVLHDLVEMIFKENKILFPLALQTLSEEEWREVRRGEDELGYIFVQPGTEWPGGPAAAAPAAALAGALPLSTGALALDQINLLLTHLPLDVTFVDEHDEVRYYSEGRERIFPRTPGVIGRKVHNCHPPKSVHIVNRIVESFRDGSKDAAEFWIRLQGKLIYIRYFAVRDAQKTYRGTLEVTQDITGIQALEGERRLLDWKD